jgi:hypothetical protein
VRPDQTRPATGHWGELAERLPATGCARAVRQKEPGKARRHDTDPHVAPDARTSRGGHLGHFTMQDAHMHTCSRRKDNKTIEKSPGSAWLCMQIVFCIPHRWLASVPPPPPLRLDPYAEACGWPFLGPEEGAVRGCRADRVGPSRIEIVGCRSSAQSSIILQSTPLHDDTTRCCLCSPVLASSRLLHVT